MSEYRMDSWRADCARQSLGERRFLKGLAEGWIRVVGSVVDENGDQVDLVAVRTPGFGGSNHTSKSRGVIRGVTQ